MRYNHCICERIDFGQRYCDYVQTFWGPKTLNVRTRLFRHCYIYVALPAKPCSKKNSLKQYFRLTNLLRWFFWNMFWFQKTTYFWLLVCQYVESFCASAVLTCQGQKSHQSIQSCSCHQNKQWFSKQKQVALLCWQITRNGDRGNGPRQIIALSKVQSKRRKSLMFSSVFMTNKYWNVAKRIQASCNSNYFI